MVGISKSAAEEVDAGSPALSAWLGEVQYVVVDNKSLVACRLAYFYGGHSGDIVEEIDIDIHSGVSGF